MNDRKILFMVSIKETESKVTSAKKNITIKDALVSELRFVDETGDVTDQNYPPFQKSLRQSM